MAGPKASYALYTSYRVLDENPFGIHSRGVLPITTLSLDGAVINGIVSLAELAWRMCCADALTYYEECNRIGDRLLLFDRSFQNVGAQQLILFSSESA